MSSCSYHNNEATVGEKNLTERLALLYCCPIPNVDQTLHRLLFGFGSS